MDKFQTAFYLGQEKETGYSGAIAEGGFFLTAEIPTGVSPMKGREFIRAVKTVFLQTPPNFLNDVDNLLSTVIRESNLALGFSVALGFIKGDILYLKTTGEGEVIIKRNNKVATLVSGDTSASGRFETEDLYVFTTRKLAPALGGYEELKTVFERKNPQEIVEEISPRLKTDDETDVSAVFLQITEKEFEEEVFIRPRGFLTKLKDEISGYYLRHGKKRTLTFALVAIIFLIFVWSVVLGYSRRTSRKASAEIKLARELVGQKLGEAEEVSFLNTARAAVILEEAKTTYTELKVKYPKNKEVDEIGDIITASESKVFKKTEAVAQEFFDLAVDDKNASGSRLYLYDEKLLVLDRASGTLFTLSLDKKSLTKNLAGELKNADLIALYEDKQYFYNSDGGVFGLVDGKVKKLINKDKDWGKISDMATFNGNLYLLDSGRDQIYKYVAAGDGFGTKTSYFGEGQAVDLDTYRSFAIDSSVFLGGGNAIIKFTAGLRDGFAMNLPGKDTSFTKIFTNRDLDRLYAWDKSAGIIYVMGKEGEFEKQIRSEVLVKGADYVVYGDKIYVLVGSKIFKID